MSGFHANSLLLFTVFLVFSIVAMWHPKKNETKSQFGDDWKVVFRLVSFSAKKVMLIYIYSFIYVILLLHNVNYMVFINKNNELSYNIW